MHAFMLLSRPRKYLDNSLVIPSSNHVYSVLKMLKLSCQNGSLCKSFFSEMRNSKFIQWICQWQKAFSIKRTHTHTFHSMTNHGSLIILSEECQKGNARSFLFLWGEREASCVKVYFCLKEYSNDTCYLSQQRNTT